MKQLSRISWRSGAALALLMGLWACSESAADYAAAWGPPTGQPLPLLAADDQDGNVRYLQDLRGEHGLLLFLVRSADW